jgi:hypothetical protein
VVSGAEFTVISIGWPTALDCLRQAVIVAIPSLEQGHAQAIDPAVELPPAGRERGNSEDNQKSSAAALQPYRAQVTFYFQHDHSIFPIRLPLLGDFRIPHLATVKAGCKKGN